MTEGHVSSVSLKKDRLASAALLLMLLSGLSAILSYLKMYITTSTFGASVSYDAFLVASTLPDVICNVMVSAMGVVFIPLFSDCANKEGTEKAQDFLNNLLKWTFLCTLFISLFFIVLSPWIVRLIAPGLDRETQKLSAQLTVIMVPIIMTMALTRLLMAFLQKHHYFGTPALGGVVNLLVIILCIYFFSKRWGIYSLAIGVALGTLGWLLLQLPYAIKEIRRYNFRPLQKSSDTYCHSEESEVTPKADSPRQKSHEPPEILLRLRQIRITFCEFFRGLDLNLALHPVTKKFALAMVPILVGATISQLGIVVERALASHLPEGSISFLGYANSMMLLPSGVFMGVIGTVLFPTLSEQASLEDWQGFRSSFSAGIRMGNLILVPSALTFIFFGNLIIQVLFERGQFVPSMTEGTARALSFYSIGMLAWAAFSMVQSSYFALQRYWTAVKIVILSTSTGILLRLLLVKPLAYKGLALSASLTIILYTLVMIWCLRDILEGPEIGEILTSFGKVLFSSLAAVYGAVFVGSYLNQALPFIQLSAMLMTGALFYFIIIYFLKVQEFYSLIELGRKFVRSQST